MRLACWRSMIVAALLSALCAGARAAECIVPSKPGGGFDMTCKLVQKGLREEKQALHIRYLPGGIGAVAWSSLLSQRRAEPNTLVAFSGGSLLNIALGKFGRASARDVRWVAGIGTDYGMIAVRSDAPYRNLRDFVAALKRDPDMLTIGAGGTIGSQDWLKVALMARQVDANPKALRFVAFEGGGEAFTALLAGHVQAVSGDVSEAVQHAADGRIRVLAVLSEKRLPGPLADVPTAREQGFDVIWPIIRGVYMGPDVPEADYRRWVASFDRMLATPAFAQWRAAAGLHPFSLTGDALTAYVRKAVDDYGREAREFGIIR